MALHVLAMLAGFAVLAVMADVFVVGAARLAGSLGIPPIIVGVVVIGFGTSLPELATAALAASHGSLGIAAGSVVGSNTVNATLVTGTAALVATPVVSPRILRREVPVALAGVLGFAALAEGGLTRLDGVILVLSFAGAITILVAGSRVTEREPDATSYNEEVGEVEAPSEGRNGETGAGSHPEVQRASWRAGTRSLLGLAGTLGGAEILVWGALGLARDTGLEQGVVGVTVVALGTSLPELVSAVQSARRGHTDLVLGNVLGSNLFNALAVGGVAALISPGPLPRTITGFPMAMMAASMVVLSVTLVTGHRLRRAEAILLLLAYAITVAVELA